MARKAILSNIIMNRIIFVNRTTYIPSLEDYMGAEMQCENTLYVYIDTQAGNSKQYCAVCDCLSKHVPAGALATLDSPFVIVTGDNAGLCIDMLEKLINKALHERGAIYNCVRMRWCFIK
jgi:hypothetical protein